MPLRILAHTYRNRPGYLITGRDTKGRSCRVFVSTRPIAEKVRAKIRAGDEITTADFQPAPDADPAESWVPVFTPWRHGGWYVVNLRYPSGAVGCVAKRDDGKWMVACDERSEPPTFANRELAAREERRLVLAKGGKDR